MRKLISQHPRDPVLLPLHFDAAMNNLDLPQHARIAVGVSGGGDSMALLFMLKDWAAENGAEIIALTVDHGLRDGSDKDAASIAATLKTHNIPHHILKWQHDGVDSRIQEKARMARYQLMIDACNDMGATVLALGHNCEDQMETFWMRLAHGSGLDGLSGMAASRQVDGITLIRPLLDTSRAELRAYCRDKNIPVIEDPSNEKPQFLRVRLRAFEDVLAAEGLTAKRLAQVLQKLEDARRALDWAVMRAMADCAVMSDMSATLDCHLWKFYPTEIRRRVIVKLLQHVAPQPYPPGAEAVDRLSAMLGKDDFTGATLAFVHVTPLPDRRALFKPENR